MIITKKIILEAIKQMKAFEKKYPTFISTISFTVETTSKAYEDLMTITNFNNLFKTLDIAEYQTVKDIDMEAAAEKIVNELINVPETITDIIVSYEIDDFKIHKNFESAEYIQNMIA